MFVLGLFTAGILSAAGSGIGWLLLRQNGRILLRLAALEGYLEQFDLGDETQTTLQLSGSPESDQVMQGSGGPAPSRRSYADKLGVPQRVARSLVTATAATLQWIMVRTTLAHAAVKSVELKRFSFVPRPDDIFIVSYPRSGTTWMQMILYQLTTDGSMEISHIAEHSPWFERSANSDQGFEERVGPRIFKSHLPHKSIPRGPSRYIYVARDGRDVAISYYQLYRSHNGYRGTFTEFFELFMRGKVMFGSWFEHVGGWCRNKHRLKVLFLTYEELVADFEGCLRRIIAFCDLKVPEDRLPTIMQRCTIAFMKEHWKKFDPATEGEQPTGTPDLFVRTGRVGDGARQLSRQQQIRFDRAFEARVEAFSSSWPAAELFRRRDSGAPAEADLT